jgi:drug/metabolite transporter (DMT)-like permease
LNPAAPAPAPRPLLGVVLIVLMSACFAVLDSSAKRLGTLLPVVVVLWSRYAFQAIAMTVWLGRPAQQPLLRAAHPGFQLVRGLLLLTVSALAFVGLQHMPVAEFTAVVMLTPVIVTMLAVWVLRERMTPLRWVLVGGGCAGALLVVRPGSGLFGWAAAIPALAALCYAAFQLLTRRLAGIEHPLTTHLYTGWVGTLGASIALAALPTSLWPALSQADPVTWALLVLVGALGTVGHLLLIFALGLGPVSLLMPFTYAQILFATLAGWVAFRHVPDDAAFTGMAVIAVCGAAAAWLNARDTRTPVTAVNADTIGD